MNKVEPKKKNQLNRLKLSIFSSTPDIEDLGFIVKVLTGTPQQLATKIKKWGYDGIEFMPDPDNIPDPISFGAALDNEGVSLTVVNSGRMAVQNMALLHEDIKVRQKSLEAFKRFIDFAGYFKSPVGLGIARGKGVSNVSKEEEAEIATDIFSQLAKHAKKAGTVVMLEAAESEYTNFANTMEEVMGWVSKIDSTGFSVMLDTYQLANDEPSIEHGIQVTKGQARHIHLYDPSRWPPGVKAEQDRLDWPVLISTLRKVHLPSTGSVVLAPEGDPAVAAIKAAKYLRALLDE